MAKGLSKKKSSSKAKSKSQKKKSVTKKKAKPGKKKSLTRTSKKVTRGGDELSEEDKFNQEPALDGNGFNHDEPTAFDAEREYDRRNGEDDDDDYRAEGEEFYS